MSSAMQDALLKASTVMYMFRALLSANSPEQRKILELHIIRLINDVSGTDGGLVILARPGISLMESVRERDYKPLEKLLPHICSEGVVFEGEITAGPLYVRGKTGNGSVEGILAVLGPNCSEVLGAVITLAATALESAREFEELRSENLLLQSEVARAEHGIIGNSPAILHVHRTIDKVAPQEATVLILGESGTGKELIARAIHRGSRRAPRPFVAINCAALTDTLLESELFGHERGAFTSAVSQKKGKLECANGGTVFLDEIGELAAGLQAKLLRVLQERTFERVGGTATLALDIRVIAATNRDLGAEAKRSNFRLDLYHRLNVVSIKSPPLRERTEDIPLLAAFFLDGAAARCHRRVNRISDEANACILRYSWPGNVRELQNAIEHAVILGSSECLLPEDLPETVLAATAPSEIGSSYHQALGETRRECVIRAWNEAGGDHDAAARLLGMHSNSLRRLIRHLQLRESLRR